MADERYNAGHHAGGTPQDASDLFWAVAYNVVAFPLAAGVFYPVLLRPEVAALAMSGSTVLVAVNALLLKRFRNSYASLHNTGRAPTTVPTSSHGPVL